LAQVLKSPLFGASDDDLIALAGASGKTWWSRLQNAADSAGAAALPAAPCSPALVRAQRLLRQWLQLAPRLPVHDLLDHILHQGEVLARYAQSASALMRAQVLANIAAFTELSLNMDAGRYPSLPKFIAALQRLQQAADHDAPDEADIDATMDAVRIMTIHSAKGLEASVVVMLDTNHSEAAAENLGVLCEWPQDAQAPRHFSAFGKKDERGAARDHLFAAEEALKQQEDWNLLYVAATRARHLLIVSGVAGKKNCDADGVVNGCWYQKFAALQETRVDLGASAAAATEATEAAQEKTFSLPVFQPPLLPPQVASTGAAGAPVSSHEIDEGIALHALMERVTRVWPPLLPAAELIAQWLPCALPLAHTIHVQAQTILSQASLQRFFDPTRHRYARNEMEIVGAAGTARFDRLVMFDDELWILDYKRKLLDSERAGYVQQMQDYRELARSVFPDHPIRAALITAD
jgi:ATP-dependent helicase/nuclease subunit A